MNNDKLREAAEKHIIEIRDKAALIANNAGDEKERFLGRQIILLCMGYLVLCNKVATAQPTPAPEPVDDKALTKAIEELTILLTPGDVVNEGDGSPEEMEAAYQQNEDLLGVRRMVRDALNNKLTPIFRAAQQEVKKLRQDNDDHAESWAMCGIPHESQLTKILMQQADIQKLRRELAELQEWKRQCLEVWNSWDVQAVGKLLDVPLGKPIHSAIAPGIEALQAEVTKLREALGEIAKQKTADELNADHVALLGDYGFHNFESVYDLCIKTAREAIDKARAAGDGKGAT